MFHYGSKLNCLTGSWQKNVLAYWLSSPLFQYFAAEVAVYLLYLFVMNSCFYSIKCTQRLIINNSVGLFEIYLIISDAFD